MLIPPGVGRIVHFHHQADTPPLAAIIVKVWNDGLVNLTVFNDSGYPEARQNVPLIQDGESPPAGDGQQYCEWMPYQKGQAAKTEALEQQLAEKE